MLNLLAALRFEKIKDFKLFKRYSLNSLRKTFLIIIIISIPFSVQHLFFYIQNKNFGINPVELYYFNSKLDEFRGNSVIASWLGNYVCSNIIPIFKDVYISLFIHFRVDENIIKKYNVLTLDEYKIAILSKSADLIIYEIIIMHIFFAEEDINDYYAKEFEYKNLIIFKKK